MTTTPHTGSVPALPPASAARLFYVDDSGAEETGIAVFAWVETTLPGWSDGLQVWLEMRKDLYAKYQIPPSAELHATKFVAGRGRPSQDSGVNLSRQDRRAAMRDALAAIGTCPDLHVGVVYRSTAARTKAYGAERLQVYNGLVEHLDARLGAAGEHGMIIMDGNGTGANGYYAAHRGLKLGARNLIEDPMFVPAHRSASVQMADFVAWTAYQSVLRHPGKRFAWDWYEDYLRGSDVNGGPLQV